MNTPLRYQATEYDCGPTAILNAITYLYATEEIPPDFVKHIYLYTLDDYNEQGGACRGGTSQPALRYMTDWFNRYAACTGYPLHCAYYEGSDVHLGPGSPVVAALEHGAVAVVRCLLECEHYVTITGMDDEYAYVFDPYYWDIDFGKPGIIRVNDHPREYNRKISKAIMECADECDYAFCKTENRVAMLFYKQGKGTVPLP